MTMHIDETKAERLVELQYLGRNEEFVLTV